MELQQIGLRHPAAELVRDVQHNRTGIPRRMFVAEGLYEHNIVLEAGVRLDTFLWCPEAAYSDEARKRSAELAARAGRAYQISVKTLERLAERPNPDGLLSIAQLPDWSPAEIKLGASALVLVADGIEIPGNLGTLIRTLDACAADCLVLTNLADTDTSVSYRDADYSGRTALVVGSERYGISPAWHEAGFSRIRIPMLGAADSLNVSISASVLLYEARARKDGW
jgi:tRNA G18 (ribose-2'-O)-methylase SpoU